MILSWEEKKRREGAFGKLHTLLSSVGLYRQDKLADALGVSRQSVAAWKEGRSAPSEDILEQMALLVVKQLGLIGALIDQFTLPMGSDESQPMSEPTGPIVEEMKAQGVHFAPEHPKVPMSFQPLLAYGALAKFLGAARLLVGGVNGEMISLQRAWADAHIEAGADEVTEE